VLSPRTERFCFQTFDDVPGRKDPSLARTLHGTLTERASVLVNFNNRGAGIFVTINEIADNQPREAENVTRVRALFIDADDPKLIPEIEQKITDGGLQPSIAVESSPGKYHYYWLVNDCQLERFKPAQKALIGHFATDKAVNDLPRVMRLPGFIHRKELPFRTRIMGVVP
jgi:RepB DNA-primase from phage plasmid